MSPAAPSSASSVRSFASCLTSPSSTSARSDDSVFTCFADILGIASGDLDYVTPEEEDARRLADYRQTTRARRQASNLALGRSTMHSCSKSSSRSSSARSTASSSSSVLSRLASWLSASASTSSSTDINDFIVSRSRKPSVAVPDPLDALTLTPPPCKTGQAARRLRAQQKQIMKKRWDENKERWRRECSEGEDLTLDR